jgi:16S rRNA (cytidine1402-2'-O)-methyltransferase
MINRQAGELYIVATPIGNLDDITQRAISTLKKVDFIAAEDTRHSARLLQHLNITTPMMAYHEHSDARRLQKISRLLMDGKSIALISDAGTPLISDPGYQLVKAVRQNGINVVPIPGVCAMVAALSVAGMPSDRFVFEGFMPAKKTARCQYLTALVREDRTLIFYESSHRILASVTDMRDILGGDRTAVVARELTKTFETLLDGSLKALVDTIAADANQQRGEFVVIVSGYKKSDEFISVDEPVIKMMEALLEELPIKKAAAICAKLTGLNKRDLYRWALEQK